MSPGSFSVTRLRANRTRAAITRDLTDATPLARCDLDPKQAQGGQREEHQCEPRSLDAYS